MKIITFISALITKYRKYASGQLLVELVVVMGLMALLLPVIIAGFVATREGRVQQSQRLDAVSLLKESEEAVRSVREKGWSTFAVNGTYHPVISGGSWSLAIDPATQDGFTTSVVVSDVFRDASGAIVTGGGSLDPSTKKIVTTIAWIIPVPSSTSTTMYLTRFMDNAAYTETTQTQFNAGTKTGTTIRATNPPLLADDGEIILGAGGHSNWCTPILEARTVDLPKNGVANALYSIEGSAFTTTGENSSGISYAQVSIGGSPPYPPNASLAYTFDGYKTNDVFGSINYAYIGTDKNSEEIVIIDLNSVISGKYQKAGYFNAPGNGSGNSIYISGNTGYMTSGSTLYNFDVSNIADCSDASGCTIKDASGVSLAGTGNRIAVSGSYVYVAVDSSSTQFQIVDASNPTNLTVVGQTQIAGAGEGVDLIINSISNRVFLAVSSSSKKELYSIDISSPSGDRPIKGSYEANGMNPKAVSLVPGNNAILVGAGGEQYQVITVITGSSDSLTHCGGLTTGININDVFSVLEADNDAFSYILAATDPEFRMIEGGPGGGYSTSGTFESQTFNPGYQTANNRFSTTYSLPSNSTVKYQVTMANLAGGVCPSTGSYTFVGPDGTTGSYFTPASGEFVTFPFGATGNYSNPGQCIRYKAYLTSNDGTSTPVLNDVTINYSP